MPHYRRWGGNKDNFRHEIEELFVKYEGRRRGSFPTRVQVGGVRPTGVILKFSITKVPECPPGCSTAFRELMMSLIQYSSVLNILTKGCSEPSVRFPQDTSLLLLSFLPRIGINALASLNVVPKNTLMTFSVSRRKSFASFIL